MISTLGANPLEALLDRARAKVKEFASVSASYLRGLAALPGRAARLEELQRRAATLPAGEREKTLAKLRALRAQNEDLGRGRSVIEASITKAREGLRKVFPTQFAEPVSLTVVAAALAAMGLAVGYCVAWLAREKRLVAELALEEKKLEAVVAGTLPPDVLTLPKPKDDSGPLDDIMGLLKLAVVAGAAFALLPLLRRSAS